MTFRKVFSHKTTSAEHASYVGRDGEITYHEGVFYVHDGATDGGNAVSTGGGSGVAWVYAGVINSIPTWYQFYF